MSEDFANDCIEGGVRCHYMHSKTEILDRIKLLQDLRNDEYDLIRINPLREDLELSEVLIVAFKESLRSQESLIQTKSSTNFLPSPGAG
jgi:excinuclease ABC subunit B